jgi:two-component system nitrate/nitrite response regulator NarL
LVAQEKLSNQHRKEGKHMNSLTNREREIVRLLASGGLSNKDVGRRLSLSEGTVKVHLHNIYQKLGVKTRTALVVLAHSEYASVSPLSHTANFEFERAEPQFA